ncbi:MAG: diguanylate cyclase, partial [Cyanobacteriota bacterium]|nr:diguanylate cyclase [Cyanobacteriota bacterium]
MKLALDQWIKNLAETEEQMRQFVEQLGIILGISDPTTRETSYQNPIAEQLWGEIGKSLARMENAWLEAIHPDDRDVVREWRSRDSQEQSPPLEYRLLSPDGKTYWIRDRSFRLGNCWICVAEDVTEAKETLSALEGQNQELKKRIEQLEIELQQAKAQLQTPPPSQKLPMQIEDLVHRLVILIETVNEGITVSDYTGNFAIYNRKMEEITGYSGEEANNAQNFLALLYPSAEARARAVAGIKEILKRGQRRDLETTIRTKNGASRTLLVSTSAIEYQGKAWFFSAYRDISDRKRAELALQLLAEQEGILRAISHQFRETLQLSEILKIATDVALSVLQSDRAIVYRLNADGSGNVAVESLASGCLSAQAWRWNVQPGSVSLLNELDSLKPAARNHLKQFNIRSQLIVPIAVHSLENETSNWGFLVVHQCSYARTWQPLEISLLSQLAAQLGLAIERAERYHQLEAANQQLASQATIDSLTQVANRRKFDEYLDHEWKRLAREQQPLSLVLCDVDFFKAYNDSCGHQSGDRTLQQIARCLRETVKRAADLVARYGGEEFAIILPNTPLCGAMCVSRAVLERIRRLNLPHPRSLVSDRITTSLGVAMIIPQPGESPGILVEAADRALYQAKSQGRDRVVAGEGV